MNTNTFKNVHEFDGKLSYIPLEHGSKTLSTHDKIMLLQDFRMLSEMSLQSPS